MKHPAPTALSVTALLVLFGAIGPLSTDLYLPALPAMQDDFGVPIAAIQLTLSVYLIAFAGCQLIYGPLSDRFGRRPVVIAGMGLYMVASIGCVLASTIEALIFWRALQAVGGCSGMVIARAVVRDVYGSNGAGPVLARIAAAMGFAPLIGPVIGGYLADHFGWETCFIALSVVGALGFVGSYLLLGETNAHRDPEATRLRPLLVTIGGMMRERKFVGFTLVAAFSYSGLFAFISGSSFVFIDLLELSPSAYGYCFAAGVGGFILGARFASNLTGTARQNLRLGVGINAGAGAMMAGIVLLGHFSLVGILVPMVVYMIGMGLVLPHAQAGAVANYPRRAGTASALFGTVQYALAACIGMMVGILFDGSALPMSGAIALAGTAAFAIWWFVLPQDGAPGPAKNVANSG